MREKREIVTRISRMERINIDKSCHHRKKTWGSRGFTQIKAQINADGILETTDITDEKSS